MSYHYLPTKHYNFSMEYLAILLNSPNIKNYYEKPTFNKIIDAALFYVEHTDTSTLLTINTIDIEHSNENLLRLLLKKIGATDFFQRAYFFNDDQFVLLKKIEFLLREVKKTEVSICEIFELMRHNMKEVHAHKLIDNYAILEYEEISQNIVCSNNSLFKAIKSLFIAPQNQSYMPYNSILKLSASDFIEKYNGKLNLENLTSCIKSDGKPIFANNIDVDLAIKVIDISTNAWDFWTLLYFPSFDHLEKSYLEKDFNKLVELIEGVNSELHQSADEIATCFIKANPEAALSYNLLTQYDIIEDFPFCYEMPAE